MLIGLRALCALAYRAIRLATVSTARFFRFLPVESDDSDNVTDKD